MEGTCSHGVPAAGHTAVTSFTSSRCGLSPRSELWMRYNAPVTPTFSSELPADFLAQLPAPLRQKLATTPLRKRSLHQMLFRTADCYAQTAASALEKLKKTGQSDFGLPAVMNLSFAIELLLKFFVALATPDATGPELAKLGRLHGHEYDKLWPRIEKPLRGLIIAQYQELTKRSLNEAQFLKMLRDLDNPFVRWRYGYESDQPRFIDFDHIGSIVTSLGRAAAIANAAVSSDTQQASPGKTAGA